MKRILIIFIGLILGCNLCLALDISCWEEYSDSSTAPATSNMRTAVTNAGGTVVLVSRMIDMFVHFATQYGASQSNLKLMSNQIYGNYDNANSATPIGITMYYNNCSNCLSINRTTQPYRSNTAWSFSGHYIYTYCAISSSGGGGGGATGSVNFIIKATS